MDVVIIAVWIVIVVTIIKVVLTVALNGCEIKNRNDSLDLNSGNQEPMV